MSKHTPGKWKSEGKRLITTMAIIISSDDSLGPIAAVTEINAPIILAAPEMYEALKDAIETAEFEKHPFRPWHKKAKDVIARIEGGE